MKAVGQDASTTSREEPKKPCATLAARVAPKVRSPRTIVGRRPGIPKITPLVGVLTALEPLPEQREYTGLMRA